MENLVTILDSSDLFDFFFLGEKFLGSEGTGGISVFFSVARNDSLVCASEDDASPSLGLCLAVSDLRGRWRPNCTTKRFPIKKEGMARAFGKEFERYLID
ncbi:Hypothetical predicted protein [Paramuricea clavata]|uniref:Uncharacterized protein n=1 Tax=Paramuricea clavata TaxID=317549 RepID=A0A7D9DMG6_PARCT|nr:Hypothetical predicted protein [Paramuricea clavata]